MNTIICITDTQEVIDIHKKTIAVSGGGADGIINIGSLDAALEHIQNDLYYPTFIDKLTHLFLQPIRVTVSKTVTKELLFHLDVFFF